MSILTIAALGLQIFLRVYTLFLWGRFIIDWIRALVPTFRPTGVVLLVFELISSVTDPPLKAIRRVIPPIPLGQVRLDLALFVCLIACWVLISLLGILIVR